MSSQENGSSWGFVAAFFLAAVPLEVGVLWTLWTIRGWGLLLFMVLIIAAFVFVPQESREYISARRRFPREDDDETLPSIDIVSLRRFPPPPRLPEDLIASVKGSTMPSPRFVAAASDPSFQETMRMITTRPPRAIN